jgi:cytochrome c oxidase subunit 3
MTDLPASKAFAEVASETEAGRFGMWIFLATEAMLFGAILLGYFILRLKYREAFATGSGQLSLPLATANTAILITSSFAMAIAAETARAGAFRFARYALWATALLGAAFLAVKAYEYHDDWDKGLLPVLGAFHYTGPGAEQVALFLNFYLASTAIHATHLLIGILLVAFLALRRPLPASRHARRVESVGLYWHFVDIVWVFLFPLLYLVQK